MNIDPKIFKAYDIRGIYPEQINEHNVAMIIRAIYTFFYESFHKSDMCIVIGHDMRISSPAIHTTAVKTLKEMGAHCIDIGLVPTTTVYDAAVKHHANACIQISASHNPKQYNGIKFAKIIDGKAIKIGNATGMDRIRALVQTQKFTAPSAGGSIEQDNQAIASEVSSAIEEIRPQHIAPMKIVVDPANAMGILIIKELMKRYPQISMKMINDTLDGTFPAHQADPSQPKNMIALQKLVVQEHAQLGVEPDGDADRIFFVDETGKTVAPTLITALVANEVLKQHPHAKILVDIRYIRNVIEVAKKLEGTAVISKVGHAFITKMLNDEGAVFAGESSGHYYFATTGGAESSVRVFLYVLEVMGREKKPISELVASYATSFESGETNFQTSQGFSIDSFFDQIIKKYSQGEVSKLDGLSISFPDWRFNIRTSNTEPLLRLNVEGKSETFVKEKFAELTKEIVANGASVVE